MEFNETTRQTALISCMAWEEPGEGVIRVSSPAVVSLSSPVGADELLSRSLTESVQFGVWLLLAASFHPM